MDQKAVFHWHDLTILNGWILLSSCGAKISHKCFLLHLVRNLIDEAETLGCLNPFT